MKPSNKIKTAIFIIFIGCCLFYVGTVLLRSYPQKENPQDYCKSLSNNINSETLQGTWIAESGFDKILIQPDNTYIQIYNDPIAQISFQTESNKWKIKNTDGITYLYLDNMHKCDASESVCILENGGGGNSSWLDFCTGEFIQMQSSIKLIVLRVEPGDIYYPLSDLKLCHFLGDPDGSSVCFRRLVEQPTQ